MNALPSSAAVAFRLVATATFRPFTKIDWMAFAGCESENPMIAELPDLFIVIDGDKLVFNKYSEEEDCEWANYTLNFDVSGRGLSVLKLPSDFDGESINVYYDTIDGVDYTFFSINGLYMNDGEYYCVGRVEASEVLAEYLAEVRDSRA